MEAEKLNPGGRHKNWGKLSLLSKLRLTTSGHRGTPQVKEKSDEQVADRIMRESTVSRRRRRATIQMKGENARAKVMERLRLRAMVRKGKVMDKIDIFKDLSTKAKDSIVAGMQPNVYQEGDALCFQGELADKLFILVNGEARVVVKFDGIAEPQEVHRFKNNSVFGESAVAGVDSVRTASIYATMETKTLELSREKFKEMKKKGKLEPESKGSSDDQRSSDVAEKLTADLSERLQLQARENEENHKHLLLQLKKM